MSSKVIRYSEAFKQKVVSELESGKYKSMAQARQVYDIRGGETVLGWVKRYGKGGILKKVVRIETADEVAELKRLRERVRELEHVLADSYLDNRLGSAYLEVACKRLNEDPEEFKKKHVGMLPLSFVNPRRPNAV